MDTEATSRLQLVGPLWGSVWPQRKGQWRKPPLTVISGRRTLTVTLNSTTCSYPSIHLPIPHLAALSAARTHEMKKKWPLLFFSAGESPMAKLVGHRKTKQKKILIFSSYIFTKSPLETFLQGRIFEQGNKTEKVVPSLSLSLNKKKKEKNRFIFFFGPPITSPSSKTGQSNVCYRAKVISKRPLGMCNLPGCLRENPQNLNLAFFFFDWGPIIDAGEQSQRRVKFWEIEVVA